MNWLSSIQAKDRAVICTIVRGEIEYGIARLADGRRKTELETKARQLFLDVPCEAMPERAGECYAVIKLARQRSGCSMDENDLWVAATAATPTLTAPKACPSSH